MKSKRTKLLIQANAKNRNIFNESLASNTFPKERVLSIDNQNITIPVIEPKYLNKKEISKLHNKQVFVEILPQFYEWLADFGSEISNCDFNPKYPITDPRPDLSKPGLSGFRLYDCITDKKGKSIINQPNYSNYFQVQVHPIRDFNNYFPGLFQLDVFEKRGNSMKNTLILACDIRDRKRPVGHFIGVSGNSFEPEVLENYSRHICTLFSNLLIYLRIWQYRGCSKMCVLRPYQLTDYVIQPTPEL